MKETCRIIKKFACYLWDDTIDILAHILTLVAAIVLLILQLIAAPFKWVAFYVDKYGYIEPEVVEPDEFDYEYEEVSLDDLISEA